VSADKHQTAGLAIRVIRFFMGSGATVKWKPRTTFYSALEILLLTYLLTCLLTNVKGTPTNIHNAVLLSIKEKPVIKECKFGIRCSQIRL